MLQAVRPPIFDSPTTRGLFDPTTGVYWASDSFATPMLAAGAERRRARRGLLARRHDMFDHYVSPWLDARRRRQVPGHRRPRRGAGPTVMVGCHTPAISRRRTSPRRSTPPAARRRRPSRPSPTRPCSRRSSRRSSWLPDSKVAYHPAVRVRRVVTGHDAGGKAIVASDTEVDGLRPALTPGSEFHRLWGGNTAPSFPDDGAEPDQRTYFPPVGGFRFGMFSVPPRRACGPPDDLEAAFAEFEAALPGLAGHMEPDAPGMHTTSTIDFEVVLEGEVWLELDNGVEVHLRAGRHGGPERHPPRLAQPRRHDGPSRRVHRRRQPPRHATELTPPRRASRRARRAPPTRAARRSRTRRRRSRRAGRRARRTARGPSPSCSHPARRRRSRPT